MRFLIIFCILFSGLGSSPGQELPPLVNYDPDLYMGGNQNWMISQASNNNIYIANSSGLLEFDGSGWTLYPVPNHTILRSVKAVGSKIFTGAYMEFGYWEENEKGRLEYHSLIPSFPQAVEDGEQFWHIEQLGALVVVQSFDGLYAYDMDNERVVQVELPFDSSVANLFKTGGRIYFQTLEGNLYLIHQGTPVLVLEGYILEGKEIRHLYGEADTLKLIMQDGQFHHWDGNVLTSAWKDNPVRKTGWSVFDALDLPQGRVVLGTVEDGLYVLGASGELEYHFNQEKGFLNNTVLGLYLDEEQNLWAGLDHGVSVINLEAPFRVFQDFRGDIGAVYASIEDEEYLYLGTNQGLYYKKHGTERFHLIPGTNGQVWSLNRIGSNLFCGHNEGTFLIEGEKAVQVADRFGTWTIQPFEGREGYFLQGHYNGFSVLKQDDEEWVALPLVEGFSHSTKFILSEEDGDLWLSNEHKGVFRIRLEESLIGISEMKNYPFDSISGITSSLFIYDEELYFSTISQVFRYNEAKERFEANGSLVEVIDQMDRVSGKIIVSPDKELWAFGLNTIFRVYRDPLASDYRLETFPLPQSLRNVTLGYENLKSLPYAGSLLGLSNGYLLFNNLHYGYGEQEVRLEEVRIAALGEGAEGIGLEEVPDFHYRANNIQFRVSVAEFREFLKPMYSFRLLGLGDHWTEWKTDPEIAYENLPHGEYIFEVKAKVGKEETPAVQYSFRISRPWYLSHLAVLFYGIFFLLLVYWSQRLYLRRHRKRSEEEQRKLRMKHLEAEQEIIRLQKEQLEKDVATKNKEVAVSAMSLVKKNEFLDRIRAQLIASRTTLQVKEVVETIDTEINEEDNWNFFKEAFEHADTDFFQRLKVKHPELTPNDLKLCAYLRLNLSSKEIAPLLNISVKSVEIKRYRLRKKIGLPREIALTEYILKI